MKIKHTLEVSHPKYGIVVTYQIIPSLSREQAINRFKNKYGDKIRDCEFKDLKTPVNREKEFKKIINIKTGDIYNGRIEAARALGVNETTIYNHLYKKVKVSQYLVKFA